jgi:branched-chain amino acid transport system ATP-binding protein
VTAEGHRAPDEALLEVDGLSVGFGGVPALTEVHLRVPRGGVVALIGPNGAGKSTLFNCVSRLYEPSAGTIRFAGDDLLSRRPHHLARLGIVRTFQNTSLFGDMTVADNVRLGIPDPALVSPLRITLGLRGARRRERELTDRVHEALDRWGLSGSADVEASALDYPRRKRVELARALVGSPTLLLLDEPAAGLGSGEAIDLGLQIKEICTATGTTALLVEHNVGMVMRIAAEIYVLAAGRNLAHGSPRSIADDPEVARVFLGSTAPAR